MTQRSRWAIVQTASGRKPTVRKETDFSFSFLLVIFHLDHNQKSLFHLISNRYIYIIMSFTSSDACRVCPTECGGFTAENPSVSFQLLQLYSIMSLTTEIHQQEVVRMDSLCMCGHTNADHMQVEPPTRPLPVKGGFAVMRCHAFRSVSLRLVVTVTLAYSGFNTQSVMPATRLSLCVCGGKYLQHANVTTRRSAGIHQSK